MPGHKNTCTWAILHFVMLTILSDMLHFQRLFCNLAKLPGNLPYSKGFPNSITLMIFLLCELLVYHLEIIYGTKLFYACMFSHLWVCSWELKTDLQQKYFFQSHCMEFCSLWILWSLLMSNFWLTVLSNSQHAKNITFCEFYIYTSLK